MIQFDYIRDVVFLLLQIPSHQIPLVAHISSNWLCELSSNHQSPRENQLQLYGQRRSWIAGRSGALGAKTRGFPMEDG